MRSLCDYPSYYPVVLYARPGRFVSSCGKLAHNSTKGQKPGEIGDSAWNESAIGVPSDTTKSRSGTPERLAIDCVYLQLVGGSFIVAFASRDDADAFTSASPIF